MLAKRCERGCRRPDGEKFVEFRSERFVRGRREVPVPVERRHDAAMPEHLLDLLGMSARLDSKRSGRVAEVVEAKTRLLRECAGVVVALPVRVARYGWLEVPPDEGVVSDRTALRAGENEILGASTELRRA